MSYFRVALQRAMEGKRWSQADLAREAGLSRSYVSRLFSGEDAALTDDNMIALLGVFSTNKASQAELVAARCMDVKKGPGAEMVEVRIQKAEDRTEHPPKSVQVELGEET